MKLGITGTRFGTTELQGIKLKEILAKVAPRCTSFHHGDCIGVDTQAANLAHELGIKIVCHPPVDEEHRAFNRHSSETHPARTHLARNRDIVFETDGMIVVPAQLEWQPRGGTWYTHDYAVKMNRPVLIIWPNGTTTAYDPKSKELKSS